MVPTPVRHARRRNLRRHEQVLRLSRNGESESKEKKRCSTSATSPPIMWYLQFFFYGMGEKKMGGYAFSRGTLHTASLII
jgi:hypothetical protein